MRQVGCSLQFSAIGWSVGGEAVQTGWLLLTNSQSGLFSCFFTCFYGHFHLQIVSDISECSSAGRLRGARTIFEMWSICLATNCPVHYRYMSSVTVYGVPPRRGVCPQGAEPGVFSVWI
jgi:hypothetical protein